jgi:hypothetical protein
MDFQLASFYTALRAGDRFRLGYLTFSFIKDQELEAWPQHRGFLIDAKYAGQG